MTVLGSVGSGAELVAGGWIYVYGTLRGRAMAGSFIKNFNKILNLEICFKREIYFIFIIQSESPKNLSQ